MFEPRSCSLLSPGSAGLFAGWSSSRIPLDNVCFCPRRSCSLEQLVVICVGIDAGSSSGAHPLLERDWELPQQPGEPPAPRRLFGFSPTSGYSTAFVCNLLFPVIPGVWQGDILPSASPPGRPCGVGERRVTSACLGGCPGGAARLSVFPVTWLRGDAAVGSCDSSPRSLRRRLGYSRGIAAPSGRRGADVLFTAGVL